MMDSALALPGRLLRVGRSLAGLMLRPAKNAASLMDRTVHRPVPPPVWITPDPGPPTAARATPAAVPEPAAPVGPEVVVDPIPLAAPAVDLTVDVLLVSELPIAGYDAMAAADAGRAIAKLTDAQQVRMVLRFEEANAKRASVLAAARKHLAGL